MRRSFGHRTAGHQTTGGAWYRNIPHVVFILVPGLAMLAPLALAPLLVACAGFALVRHRLRGDWRGILQFPPPLAAVAALLLWAGITALWAPDRPFAVLTIARTAGCAVAGWLIVTDLRAAPLPPSAVRGLAAGLLWAAILLLLAETAEHSLLAAGSVWAGWAVRTVTHMDRGTTVCVLLLWPVLIGLWRQGSPAAALFVLFVVAFACGLSHDAAAKVALLLGGAVLAVTAWLAGQPRRWLIRGIVALLAVATVLAPLAAWRIPPPEETIHWHWLMRTAHHRLTIWRFVGETLRAAPLRGAGLEASRRLDQGRHVVLIDDAGERRDEELLPLHPHDAPLQLWLETGAVGAILAAIVLLTLGARLAVPPDHRVPAEDGRPAGIAMLVSAFFFGAVSYGLWQSWWQSTLWLSVALWCGLSPRRLSG